MAFPTASRAAGEPAAAAIRIARPEAAWFASDMHLDDSEPALAGRFLRLLDDTLTAMRAGSERPCLFLLGDIFEYWVGDDHLPDVAQSLARRLIDFTRAGGRAFLMHGNRDFLMDAPLVAQSTARSPDHPPAIPFSVRCGALLLPDPTVIEVAGRRIALSHGDGLCTDDTRYQQWRLLCRSSVWQQQFLARPVAERLAMAQRMRHQSMQAQAATETVSDVNPTAVDALMTQSAADLLIHGHTHQPMLHRWRREGSAAAADMGETWRLRWVLSDWAAEPPRGEILPITEASCPLAPAETPAGAQGRAPRD